MALTGFPTPRSLPVPSREAVIASSPTDETGGHIIGASAALVQGGQLTEAQMMEDPSREWNFPELSV